MAKIKSIKCYNFVMLKGAAYMTFNIKFYDSRSQLIVTDFSNPIKNSSTYCENSDFIVTANGVDSYYGGSLRSALHTGDIDIRVGLSRLENFWTPPRVSNSFINIEFKTPEALSDIQILHSFFGSSYGFDTCDYDIEYEDSTTETHKYVSDGKPHPVHWSSPFDQEITDAEFDSIEFNGKTITVYDTKVGYVETLDNNNFRNIPVNKFEKIKVLYTNPTDTFITGLISFDNKTTWKAFDGLSWTTISDVTPNNILLNGMSMDKINNLDKNKLIAGGFTGNMDFLITMKTNDVNKTPSITKIYIEYKNN